MMANEFGCWRGGGSAASAPSAIATGHGSRYDPIRLQPSSASALGRPYHRDGQQILGKNPPKWVGQRYVRLGEQNRMGVMVNPSPDPGSKSYARSNTERPLLKFPLFGRIVHTKVLAGVFQFLHSLHLAGQRMQSPRVCLRLNSGRNPPRGCPAFSKDPRSPLHALALDHSPTLYLPLPRFDALNPQSLRHLVHARSGGSRV